MEKPKEKEEKINVGDKVESPTGLIGEVLDVNRDEGPDDSDLLNVEFENGLKHWRSSRTVEFVK